MNLLTSVLTFTMYWKLSWSLQCYTCDPEHTTHACGLFDYSNKYLTECEHSTMCFKRVTTLDFNDGLASHSVQRGCAQQTMNGEQKKINGKWRATHDIHEVYDETCFEDPSNAERPTKTLHCYCRGDRCNGVQKTNILELYALLAIALWMIT
ncbi:uncharacterized protein LOC113502833 [Trichoplusia ni]|uniref:Uncharacterized protein LOC113502833 n=1 Tax=Trichoplusia ni TaxID=7111 RepID=A0A7E5WI43_TRINI|nr:uncharacterized protein LOC113502833 [Trichoplusia ni]